MEEDDALGRVLDCGHRCGHTVLFARSVPYYLRGWVVKHTTAGKTRKTHKSVKTTVPEPGKPESSAPPTGKPSLPVLPTVPLPIPENSLALVLTATQGPVDKNEHLSTGVPQIEPQKQWWFRHPDSKARKIAEKIFIMRAAGRESSYIAKKLDTTEGAIRQYVYMARKNGWVNAEDEPVDMETELALDIDRKVVRNISASLDGQMTNWQTHEMTLAAAKGRGHFKNHDSAKADAGPAMAVVAIQVVMPSVGAADQRPDVGDDQMGGVPAYLEADTLEGM